MFVSISLSPSPSPSLSLSLPLPLPLPLPLSIDASFPKPQLNLPKELLSSIVKTLISLPPLSISHTTHSLSPLTYSCLTECKDFIKWVLSSSVSNGVSNEERRLALEISLLLSVQEGTLSSISTWILTVLDVLSNGGHNITVSVDICHHIINEIHNKTVSMHTLLHCFIK